MKLKPETQRMIQKGLDDLRDDIAAEVEEEDRDEKKKVLRIFACIDLAVKRAD